MLFEICSWSSFWSSTILFFSQQEAALLPRNINAQIIDDL